jgi:TetR/AcrR family transcriptional regulator
MPIRDSQTEELIKATAKKLFFSEGKFRATTQEIADAAGVNRTLVNYYFRSRDHLFELVLKDARQQIEERMGRLFQMDLPFREKIGLMIDELLESVFEYPFMDIYTITSIKDVTEGSEKQAHNREMREKIGYFLKEVEKERKKGTIRATSAVHFFLTLTSLMGHPITFRGMYQIAFDQNDKQYKKLLKERRELILEMLFK